MKVKRDCIICGKSYVINHWVLRKGRGLTCSYGCGRKSAAQKFSGPRVERLKLYCQICGQLFLILPGEMRPNKKYCSRKCTNKGRFKSSLVQCAQCGKDLWRPPYQIKKTKKHYCNRLCFYAAIKSHGKEPKKIGEKRVPVNTVKVNCGFCNKEFLISESRFKWGRGKYCSPKCQYAAIKARPSKTPQVSRTCIGCGKIFEISKRTYDQGKHRGVGKYCSRPCRDKYWKGPNTSNYIDGNSTNAHGPNWQSQRRKALRRDDSTCQDCTLTNSESLEQFGQPVIVHHKTPFRFFSDDYETANQLTNLVTLCHRCHRKAEAKLQALAKA